MIMTEIVADKTVEVVKNAIETADGALDLYNKYLDQVILADLRWNHKKS